MASNKRQQLTQEVTQKNLDTEAAEREAAEAERILQEEAEAKAAYEAEKQAEVEQAEQEAALNQEENTPNTVQEGTLDTDVIAEGEVTNVNDTESPVGETIADSFVSAKEVTAEGQVNVQEPEVNVTEPTVETNALELQNTIVEKPLSQAFDANQLMDSLSPLGQTAFYQIQEYMDAMAPGRPMNEVEGVKHQVKLYRALDIVFNRLSDEDFRKFYPALLYLFHEYGDEVNGVFSMVHVYRFPEYLTLSTVEQDTFHRLLNMMIVTANPTTRPDAIRSLNWAYTLGVGLTDDARARVQSFYQV